MEASLFSKPAKYTMDASSLMEIFNDTPWISKKDNPSLWKKIEALIEEGVIISHIEVLKEIKTDGIKGEELYNWGQANKSIFLEYDEYKEGNVIRLMTAKHKDFVNDNVSSEHADPWLVAQAKVRNLTIISQEKGGIPRVCADPMFDVKCIDLYGLIKAEKWSISVGT